MGFDETERRRDVKPLTPAATIGLADRKCRPAPRRARVALGFAVAHPDTSKIGCGGTGSVRDDSQWRADRRCG